MSQQVMILGLDGPLLRPYDDTEPERSLARHLKVGFEQFMSAFYRSLPTSAAEDHRQWLRQILVELGIRRTHGEQAELLRHYVQDVADSRPRQPGAMEFVQQVCRMDEFRLATWPDEHPVLGIAGKQAGFKLPEISYFAKPYGGCSPEDRLVEFLSFVSASSTDTVFVHRQADVVEMAERLGLWGFLVSECHGEAELRRAREADFEIVGCLDELLERL